MPLPRFQIRRIHEPGGEIGDVIREGMGAGEMANGFWRAGRLGMGGNYVHQSSASSDDKARRLALIKKLHNRTRFQQE